jgi:hypothetical protein
LFRERPELAVEVLRELVGVDVPVAAPVRLESNDFNDRPSKDFQPDTVITIGPPQAPVHGIVVEVQQEKAEAKRKQLPRYAAALWLLLRCPVTVLCVCPEPEAAAHYAKPIQTELPGYVFRAAVLGPGDVPVITDAEEAAARPELAAMAVMAHGRHRPVAAAFVAALSSLKIDHAPQYYEYAYGMAAPAVRRILEELMSSATWPVYSPFAREHYGHGKDDGRAEGRVEGRAEGRVEGRAEGRVEGRVEAEAGAVLRVLAARGIDVPQYARARILACADTEQLDRWLDDAVVASSIADLFD